MHMPLPVQNKTIYLQKWKTFGNAYFILCVINYHRAFHTVKLMLLNRWCNSGLSRFSPPHAGYNLVKQWGSVSLNKINICWLTEVPCVMAINKYFTVTFVWEYEKLLKHICMGQILLTVTKNCSRTNEWSLIAKLQQFICSIGGILDPNHISR
jgi:hypothetical protein